MYFGFLFCHGHGRFLHETVDGGGHFALGGVAGGETASDGGLAGFLPLSGALKGQGQGVPERGLAGEDLGCLLVGIDGVLQVAGFGGVETPEEVGFGVVGIAFERGAEECGGADGIAPVLPEDHGEFEVGRGVRCAGSDGFGEPLFGCRDVAGAEGEEAALGGRTGRFGGEFGPAGGEGEADDEIGGGVGGEGCGRAGGVGNGVSREAGGEESAGFDGPAGGFEQEALAHAEGGFGGAGEGDSVGEGGEQGGGLLADAGGGEQIVHDGPALGVETGDAGAFFAERRVGPGFEKFAFTEPGGLIEQADVRFDGAANGPTFVVELGGGVELGQTFFEPEGAAGAGVFEEGVDEFVGEGAFAIRAAPVDDDPVFVGAGLEEAADGGRGAEGGEEILRCDEDHPKW